MWYETDDYGNLYTWHNNFIYSVLFNCNFAEPTTGKATKINECLYKQG